MEITDTNISKMNNSIVKEKTSNMNQLPLSWIYSLTNVFSNPIKIGFSTYWIQSSKISHISFIKNILNLFSDNPKSNFIIRGCNRVVSNFLSDFQFNSLIIGKEAIIDLDKNPFTRRSLRELVKRGFKHGKVEEIDYSENSATRLEELKSCAAHADEPQLKFLFVDEFKPETRLFVFTDNNKTWQGAILISQNSPTKMQTELLLRRKTATNGTMEALIFFIYEILNIDSFTEWSLGEVPFIVDPSELQIFSQQYIINKIGRMLKYAYNYEGLYFFKNKFATRWENLYLCAKPRVKLIHIIMLSIKSNLFSLTVHKVFK